MTFLPSHKMSMMIYSYGKNSMIFQEKLLKITLKSGNFLNDFSVGGQLAGYWRCDKSVQVVRLVISCK